MKIYGCKILKPNNQSLNGKVTYRYDWQDVPGNGAYVAITGGATSAGAPPADAVIRWFECDLASEQQGVDVPYGMRCFRRVRMLKRRPAGITQIPAEYRNSKLIAQDWHENGQQESRREYRNGERIA